MISYVKFKELFEALDSEREPEIEIYFKDKQYSYMIIKYSNYVTFQRCGMLEEQSGEINFNSIDELYNSKTVDNIILKNDWDNIEDIVIDAAFSVAYDKDDILNYYGVSV